MKIVVIGGTGLIGSRLVSQLSDQGHEVIPASPRLGVNTITGEGLAAALAEASVVVDVSDTLSFEYPAVLDFFRTSTRNLLAAERSARVRCHVALSIVGTPKLSAQGDPTTTMSGYFVAKLAQESLIASSSIPYTIVRATQFFEFIKRIADQVTVGNEVRVSHIYFQPMAADDVARALARAALGPSANAVIEIGGPDRFRLDEIMRRVLAAGNDPRTVVTDPSASYYGIPVEQDTIVPGADASLGEIHVDQWLAQRAAAPVAV